MFASFILARAPAVLIRTILLLSLTLGSVAVAPVVVGDQAKAQEVRERRSIIEMIFGVRRKKKVQKPAPAVKPVVKKKPTSTDQSVNGTGLVIQKLPTAQKVLIIGDFMASALADGLTTAFAADPNIVIVKRTNAASGLARTGNLNWPKTLAGHVAEIKPSMVVIMVGTNDRQTMNVDGKREKFQSQGWIAEYDRRISELIGVASRNRLPFIWTGLPSFQSPSLSADAATLNNLYRSKSELVGGEFIDIWDGFADENGKFVATGSDINGQPVRLRGSDGFSFTKAGKRKMAFYIEKSIRSRIGIEAAPTIMQLSATRSNLDSSAVPTIADIVAVPPISLADPELDGGARLLDANLIPKSTGLTPRDKLVEKGETIDPPQGRLDDFRWQKVEKPAG